MKIHCMKNEKKREPALRVPRYKYLAVLSELLDCLEQIDEPKRDEFLKLAMIARLMTLEPGEQLVLTLDGIELIIELV
ncbi:hypothetical protein [Gallibacterium genomosp. 1]|uniref:Uncharacterized protein n=1 Tax=Gallibacterium genomosp. 1 TaxID=155515 RepID=A0A0A2Y1H3_9PAST|nr:hypothetical protein [Gallibacterium genomosp. 1]KGQ36465.1 hypothetical protein JP36_10045 [Gallibacterium genomosp. 1]